MQLGREDLHRESTEVQRRDHFGRRQRATKQRQAQLHTPVGSTCDRQRHDEPDPGGSHLLGLGSRHHRARTGYGAWMAAGATTLWEQWTNTRSKGHPFLGTAEDWMLADIAGRAQTGNASTKVVVKPHLPTGLQ